MPVTDSELTTLASSHDIISLGVLADDVRRQRHGTQTTFVRVTTVTAEAGAPATHAPSAGEVRIVGTPASRTAAIDRVREVAAKAGRAVVTGFALSDLEALSAKEGVTLRALLEELKAAGLELVADAPIDRLQDARRSIEEVNIAGLSLARLTVDQSPSSDPMPLLKRIADLQRTVAVIRAFAPLPRRINPAAPTTGYDDVKHVALARIVVENIASIQVDWSLYGPKLAQVALTVGADDVDAVSPEDETTEGRRRAPLEEIRRNIRAAGLDPVERNGRFDLVSR
jgi:aminodeoxyfutalosine synthase